MTTFAKTTKVLIKDTAELIQLKPSELVWVARQCTKEEYCGGTFASIVGMLACRKASGKPQRIAARKAIRKQQMPDFEYDFPSPRYDNYLFLFELIENFYINNIDFTKHAFVRAVTKPPAKEITLADLFPEKSEARKAYDNAAEMGNNAVRDESDFPPAPVVEVKVTKYKSPSKWEPQQEKALKAVFKWLKDPNRKQIFRLFGYAGTGKTTLALEVAEFLYENAGKGGCRRGNVLAAAYTGQAASVLRSKGLPQATTLCSIVYRPNMDPVTGLIRGFTLNAESPLSEASLLILDEASMINEEQALDAMSFGCPILVLGDPGQLKPISGEGYFVNAEPDVLLTDIRRQEKDSPIIYLATRARNGLVIKPGDYGNCKVLPHHASITNDMLLGHTMTIAGMNNTRKAMNVKARKALGFYEIDPVYPVMGETLMCLKNNQDKTLFNGTRWMAGAGAVEPVFYHAYKNKKAEQGTMPVLKFRVRSLDSYDSEGRLLIYETQVPLHLFNTELGEPHWSTLRGTDEFDFGYCGTGHKTQGSQSPSVLVIDESDVFKDQKYHWQYTTFTRAVDQLTIRL